MQAVLIVGIVFGSIVAVIAIISAFVLAMIKTRRGGWLRGSQLTEDETRLIQELHQGLARMEERVEALETILMDREAKKERKSEK